ncbi:MAG TPA: hypothetical protein VMT20_06990 [Terriglobia bacterium]|nr:hypothetical protein [Terriglobia bacterium]
MTIIAGLLVVALIAQQFLHRRHMENVEARNTLERQKLLERIQHPEIRPIVPSEPVEYEMPKDEAELAQVGLIVPEFVQVGENQGEANVN